MDLLDFIDLLDLRIIDSLDSRYNILIKPPLKRLPEALIINIINLLGSNNTIFKLIIFSSPRTPKPSTI